MNDYLLLDGTQIPVSAELAQVVGLNEAIVLQEVYYWCKVNRREKRPTHDGYYWVYNSYRNWSEKHFPWWSPRTIQRIFEKLEKQELIITGNYNKSPMDQTKWYRINFPKLHSAIKTSSLGQSDQMDLAGLSKPIPDIITERNNNGFFAPPVAEKSLSSCNYLGPDPTNIPDFIQWYYQLYEERRGEKHPNLKPEQTERVTKVFQDFLQDDEFAYASIEALRYMAEDFFDYAESNDWRINHFASRGVLKVRYYNVYFH